jgi:arabinose-5-phosphate isomerase
MGDALALALLRARNFTTEDFAQLHPGGFLGYRLLKRVSELHHSGEALPLVSEDTSMKEMILQMTGKRLGCVVTADSDGRPSGIFTDGDLRRLAEHQPEFFELQARQVMNRRPKLISEGALVDAALAQMEAHAITQLVSVDRSGRVAGVIHLHDILKSKLI